MSVKQVTYKEFLEMIKLQKRDRREDITFECPRCGTVQSGQELIDAGVGKTFEDVQPYLGFSCIGRFTKDKGCNWTLGGLFQIHKIEVITDDGEIYPCFEPKLRHEETGVEA
jgi:hypothetical protein